MRAKRSSRFAFAAPLFALVPALMGVAAPTLVHAAEPSTTPTSSLPVPAATAPADAAGSTSIPTLPPPPTVDMRVPTEAPAPTASALVAPIPALPAAANKRAFVELASLRLLAAKGYITQAEYEAAMRDLAEFVGSRGTDAISLAVGKVTATLYGFAQADVMWHSTQSFNDYGSNFAVARPGTFAGEHGRTQFSVRDSRLGVRLQAPALSWLRASAVLEMDFLGPTGTVGSTITEASYFNNPNFRIRHAYFKVETPIVDILFGHYWYLFGWQPNYFPTVVQWPGLVGELFSRTAQLRLSKTLKWQRVVLELAVAANRPPERDSMTPDMQAGVRLSFPKWTAVHTNYLTATTTAPASIGIAGDVRHFTLPEFSAMPQEARSATGGGISVSAYLPIVPATKEHKDNSLSLIGEFVTGAALSEMYIGLTGGLTNPALPNPSMQTPAPVYTPAVDAGLAVYDASGNLRLPRWTTFMVGAEYYLPKIGGRVALFANYSRSQLHDAQSYGNGAKVRDHESFCNAGLFFDLSDSLRFGMDYGRFNDVYADGVEAVTHAVQGTGFFFF
jgi:hypothetical protein